MFSTTCKEEVANRGTAQQFITERRYLKNVTPKTIIWYEQAFKSFHGCEDRTSIVQRIGELRERGVKAVSVNSWLRVLKAYWKWRGEKLDIPRLKEEHNILATFTAEQINRLVHWKPIGGNEARAHIIALAALDTGLRISELLGLSREQVDFDNLTIRVKGKGNKHRLVPMSVELRKALYRYLANHSHARVFCTRSGSALSVRNSERDFKVMCGKAGITGVRASWHTLRHTFAVNYLRKPVLLAADTWAFVHQYDRAVFAEPGD